MNWESFVEQLAEWFGDRGLLTPKATWVVGVSGGPDSVVLLHGLKTVSEWRGLEWGLHVAHLHHGLRGSDADEDAAFVAALADKLGVAFHHERMDLRAQLAETGGSVEEVARQRRYEFLERVALQAGSETVAVGHHADDNAETIFHRICRGTGLRGLGGMADIRAIQPGSRIRLVRPFLQQRRTTIQELCELCGFQYRLDATNQTTEFARGRIRNVVLPLLRESLNPNVSEALLRLAEQARWLETYLEDAAARTFDSLVVSETPRQIVLNIRALQSKQRIIQAEVVRRAVSLVLGREQDLGFVHVEAVLKLADDPGSGKEVHLPGAILVRKQYDRLEFRPRGADASDTPLELPQVFVEFPGRTPLPALGLELTAEICEPPAGKIDDLRRTPHPYEEWIDLDRVRPPLMVRGRREGDRFWPLGAPGAKTLSDFFIGEKIDPSLRARTGVLCDQAGPVWVIPLRIDERVKLRATTRRALRLVLTPARPPGGNGA